jgi:hypothetical protein
MRELIPPTPFHTRLWRFIRWHLLGLHNEPTPAERAYAWIERASASMERPSL